MEDRRLKCEILGRPEVLNAPVGIRAAAVVVDDVAEKEGLTHGKTGLGRNEAGG
jgi:hypothetical protein